MSDILTIHDLPDITGKKVLVRSELNAPIKDGNVTDRYRLEKAAPTLEWLSKKGAKVLVVAHLGREPTDSLEPVYKAFETILPNIKFVPDLTGKKALQAVEALENGEILLLENVRSDAGEKENNDAFSQKLASYAEYYVDDAFGATHRNHASIVGVPKYLPAYAGLLVAQEIEGLEKALVPEAPSLFILGGAKFETKEAILKVSRNRYDHIFIGGALANDFLKASGHEVGESLVSPDSEKIQEMLKSKNILLPQDVRVKNEDGVFVKHINQVQSKDTIVDVGPESVTELGTYITRAKSIVWNGPLGLFEEGHGTSTEEVAELIADSDGVSIVGGGDTVAAIRNLALEEKFTFISTGGGAMLDYLTHGKLPGIQALIDAAQ